MSSGSRASLWISSLMLCLVGSASSQSQRGPSSPAPPQSAVEATVRRLTEEYILAIAGSDLQKIRAFWNPESRDLAPRLRFYKDLFQESRLEFVRANVTSLEIAGDNAISLVTSDERQLDKKTGAGTLTYDPVEGCRRRFEWIRTTAGWKLENEFVLQEALAARLEAVSDRERDEILEKEQALVTVALIRAFASRGMRHHQRGDSNAAMRSFRLQEVVSERMGNRVGIAGAWMNYGMVKTADDDYEEAVGVLRKALQIYEADGVQLGVILSLERLSKAYYALGDHWQAFICAQRSLTLCEKAGFRRGIATALSNLADIYGEQGNPAQALAYQQRALPIVEELGASIFRATLLYEMAIQHTDLGDYDRALEIYNRLLKQTEGYGDIAGAAMVRDRIGNILSLQGKLDEALSYHRKALEVRESFRQGDVIVTLRNITGVYLAQGKYSEALPFAEEGLSQSRRFGSRVNLWEALSQLGDCHFGLNHPSEAQRAYAEAVSIAENLRSRAAGGAGDTQRYFEGGLRAHHGMIRLLVGENRPREALVFAERAKARVLLDVLQQGRVNVQKAMTPQEREQERKLKSELTQLNLQLSHITQSDKPDQKLAGELGSRLEKARLDYEAFRNSLYAAHPELKVQRGEAPVIDAKDLAALLSPSSALLEYVVTDDNAFLFTITRAAAKPEADVNVYTLGIKQRELARRVEEFRRQLAGRDLGFRAAANKLYELLLKPAAAQLNGKTDLVITPDRTLWDLPFQALVNGANRFMIEDAAIAYAPSLTVLREMTKRRSGPEAGNGGATLLALGNPSLVEETISRAALKVRDRGMDPLPEAEQEVRALSRLYGDSQSKVYTGHDASEDRFKNEATRARILHFATHAILNNASPMYSHLALAQGGADEDGLLEAWELMQLDLKADLAVLSACETARGRIGAGEGMIGLSWAMFIAGVPTTVVSQWKVEAAATRDLMVNFHGALISRPVSGESRLTRAQALRQAALKLMRKPETHHPFYWAAFVLVGDSR